MHRWRWITGLTGGRVRQNLSNSRLLMISGLGSIVLLLVLGLAMTWSVLETKSALRAYATGESLWSKGKEDTVHALGRYAETGEEQWLARARDAIAGPAGYRQARKSLEAKPVNLERAREGFTRGGSHPEDIPRMIWLFRYFHEFSHFHDAVTAWRDSDDHILRLQSLSQAPANAQAAAERRERIRAELDTIRTDLRTLQTTFLANLGRVDRWLSRTLFITVVVVLLIVALIAMALFRWAAARITRSESQLRTTLENAGVGMAIVDRRGIIRFVNHRLCDILDYPSDMLVDCPLSSMPDNTEAPIDIDLVRAAFDPVTRTATLERQHLHNDETPMWLRFTFSSGDPGAHQPDSYIMVAENISEERNRLDTLTHEASHDPLTGLHNRRELVRRLEHAIDNSQTEGGRHVLCFIDLDGFKTINDTCNHRAGDIFLMELAETIRSNLREGDILARLGGDEFAIILSHCPLEAGANIVEQLRTAIENFEFHWELRTFQVTASAGLIELGPHTPDAISTLETADRACYQAKQSGRNRIVAITADDGKTNEGATKT